MCCSGTESKTAHQCRGGVLITCYSIIYSDLPSGLFDHIALTFIFSCCSGGPQSAPPAALWHQIMIMNTGVRESQPDTVERHYLLSSNWMFLVRPLQYSRHNFTAEPSPRLASILTNLTLTRDDISTRDSLRRMTVSLQSLLRHSHLTSIEMILFVNILVDGFTALCSCPGQHWPRSCSTHGTIEETSCYTTHARD